MATNDRHAVLLHGLGRTSRSMRPLVRALSARGYETLNLGYPSRSQVIEALAEDVAARIAQWNAESALDFVTHSLGGIVLRAAVANGALPLERIRRVVMLGPPNQGSELVDAFALIPVVATLYRRVTGPAGAQLGVSSDGIAAHLPPVEFPVGVIAGNRSFNPLFSAVLGAPNDGKVRVDRAQVTGMRDFLVVPHWHPFLMSAPSVIEQSLHFLETGNFATKP